MDLKWILLIAAEAIAWLTFFGFIVARYWFEQERASRIVGAVFLLDNLFILGLGAWDFADTGEVSAFHLVIAGLLLYTVAGGHKDMRKLDRRVGAWVRRLKVRRAGAGAA